jgi:AraC family transcriptional regulator
VAADPLRDSIRRMVDEVPPVRVGRQATGFGFCISEVDYAAGWRQPPHAHESTGVTLVVAGGFRETACGREESASALSVVVKPAGVVHADEIGREGARTVLVEIEDPALLPEELGPWRWLHAGPGVRPLLALARALRGPSRSIEDTVLELLGEVSDAERQVHRNPPAWIDRAREALDDADPTTTRVRDLAAELDVHPVSLTRAFRRHFGLPVTVYRRRARLRRAAAQLGGSTGELSRIAHAAGFADHAHMCRDIRAATGCTPSELRAAARRG